MTTRISRTATQCNDRFSFRFHEGLQKELNALAGIAGIDQTATFMQCFFGMPVELLADKPFSNIPKSAKRIHPEWKVSQILSTYLLDKVLTRVRPKDAVAVLGLTSEDLWPGKGWNFVFGQASLSQRVGVWSLYRNGDLNGSADEKKRFLRRTLKTAVHETGHMLTFPHCTAFECGMNGSNGLEESDRQSLEFCPECQSKISWTCGCDFKTRYQNLLDFGEKYEFNSEVDYWTRSQLAISE